MLGGVGESVAPEIFVSYRQSDSRYFAGWIQDQLSKRFGSNKVFLDADAIRPGTDYLIEIRRAISSARIMLVLVGPNWLDSGATGASKLSDPTDPVRLELEEGAR
jgi:hypothetical protein